MFAESSLSLVFSTIGGEGSMKAPDCNVKIGYEKENSDEGRKLNSPNRRYEYYCSAKVLTESVRGKIQPLLFSLSHPLNIISYPHM